MSSDSKNNRIAWMTLTSGRKDYLEQSRQSWYDLVNGNIVEEVIVDTSGNSDYSAWLSKKYTNATIFSLSPDIVIREDWNSGIRQAYDYFYDVARSIECDYIFHTEDDYVLLERIDLENCTDILKSDKDISQVHFMRQPWSREEIDAGGVLRNCQNIGFKMTEKNNSKNFWVEHRAYFSFGPSVYSKDICFIEKDMDQNPELAITYKLFQDLNKKVATFGRIDDRNIVEHIGVIKG